MGSGFSFNIYKPTGRLSPYVQAIWVARTAHTLSEPMLQYLNCDGCSGLVFNLGNAIHVDNVTLPFGVITQPISTKTALITLPAGSHMVGIRFHPSVGRTIADTQYPQLTLLNPNAKANNLYKDIFSKLIVKPTPQAQIVAAYRWLSENLPKLSKLPDTLKLSIERIKTSKEGKLFGAAPVSLRQIERDFKKWLGITPKHLQRVIRVHQTLKVLKANPTLSLADVAYINGFTDQAHMTRELQQMAQITPRRYRLLATNEAQTH